MKPKALWITEASKAQLLEAQQGDGVAVETLFSGISRGTEKLVFEGRVPESEHQTMRSPRQEGEFTFPVKYGYCNVGKVLEGDLAGKLVFALHPHQDNFRAHSEELTLIPEGVPAERAVLAANMETALNIVWDSGAQAADKVAIVGAGVIGLLTGYLASRLPGSEVTLVDINPAKEVLARELGCSFATAENAPKECDVVIHTSATNEGL
ncbi:MAG TPA: zinc-binding alcohol dehydrogenase, partial [Aquiluna sp.]